MAVTLRVYEAAAMDSRHRHCCSTSLRSHMTTIEATARRMGSNGQRWRDWPWMRRSLMDVDESLLDCEELAEAA